MQKIIVVIFMLSALIYAQEKECINFIGDFGEASSFSYLASGYFIVADKLSNEIYKVDSLGNVNKEIGGYGWQPGLFDSPEDVFSNELNTYICDKNNDRIVVLDRNLNFVSILKTHDSDNQDADYKQPTCFGINNQSDFFILDSYNQRILKYNLRGDFTQQIGSYDSGNFYLSAPNKFALSPDGKLFIINGSKIFVFDQFGTGLVKIDIPLTSAKIKIYNTILTISNNTDVYTLNLSDLNSGFVKHNIKLESKIIEAIYTGIKLYILTDENILVYE